MDPEYRVFIVDDCSEIETSDRDPDCEHSKNDTRKIHNIRGFQLDGRSNEIPLSFKPDKDKSYFLLYVLYKDGDSFHKSEGNIEFIGMYQDEEVARDNKSRIEAHYAISRMDNKKTPKGFKEYSVNLVTEEGTEFTYQVCWNGYFERLESVEIDLVRRIK